MYGIYANIWGILMVNVTIYSIHGSYGYDLQRGIIPFNITSESNIKTWWKVGFFYDPILVPCASRAPVVSLRLEPKLRCLPHKNRFSGSTNTEFASAKYRIKMDYQPPISDSWHIHSNRPRVRSNFGSSKSPKSAEVWTSKDQTFGFSWFTWTELIICVTNYMCFPPPQKNTSTTGGYNLWAI